MTFRVLMTQKDFIPIGRVTATTR